MPIDGVKIYENLYAKFQVENTDKLYRADIENTNLYQVARIASTQPNKCNILTFNFDNILEMMIDNHFSATVESSYRYSHSGNPDPKVEIIHSHGFFPYEPNGKSKSHGIVLSSYEYMSAYERAASYARKKLSNQLRKKNILIGNSLTDYEEQKVLFSHHRRYLSDFNYLFTIGSGNGNEWMDYYRTIYYLKMGVIPVF